MPTDTYTTFLQEPEPKDREQSIEAYVKTRLQSLDRAVAGYTSVSLQGLTGNVDLTPTQAKHRVIQLTGVPAGAVTLRTPYATGANADVIFVNKCTGSFSAVTVKSMGANAGNAAGVPLPGGGWQQACRHDGESAYPTGLMTDLAGRVPQVRAYHSIDQSLTSGIDAALSFNGERYDYGGFHSTVSSTSRLTVPPGFAGLYRISGTLRFASNAAGYRYAVILLNGGLTGLAVDARNPISGFVTALTLSTTYRLADNDYLELIANQTAGVGLNVVAIGNSSPEFMMEMIGR